MVSVDFTTNCIPKRHNHNHLVHCLGVKGYKGSEVVLECFRLKLPFWIECKTTYGSFS